MKKFPARLALQQRVLPHYRVPFFDALARATQGGLALLAGDPRPEEHIGANKRPKIADFTHTKNYHLLRGSLYFCYQEGLIDWLEENDPAALIVEATPRYLATPAAIRWMKKRGRPVIGWGLGAPRHAGLLAGFRQKNWMRFLNNFDALIAYSERGAADYASYGIPEERIFVARNAAVHKPKGGLLTRPLRQDYEPLVVLFVGRLQERKRIDNLLRASAALPKNLQPNLWIVGDGPAREALEALAEEIFSKARFLGERHGAELDHIWAEADLFVLPGTGGLAVQEAMSHALPVIVAKGDGTQDDLVRPENGWQIPPDDPDALEETLAIALSDPPRLRSMGAGSYRIVRDEINIEKMVEVFIQVSRHLTMKASERFE